MFIVSLLHSVLGNKSVKSWAQNFSINSLASSVWRDWRVTFTVNNTEFSPSDPEIKWIQPHSDFTAATALEGEGPGTPHELAVAPSVLSLQSVMGTLVSRLVLRGNQVLLVVYSMISELSVLGFKLLQFKQDIKVSLMAWRLQNPSGANFLSFSRNPWRWY